MNNSDIVRAMEMKVKQALKKMPKLVGNDVVNFAKDNFKRQGFLGDTLQMWPKRKTKTKWGITPRNNGRAILVDKARLKRATRVTQADWSKVIVSNSTPYARAHNEGLRIGVIQQVKAHRRKRKENNLYGNKRKKIASGVTFVKAHKRRVNMKLPKRQFLGNSPYLSRNIQRTIANELQKALK